MIKTILKYKFHILGILILVGIGYLVFIQGNDSEDLRGVAIYKCPADYSSPEDLNNDEEYRADIDIFVSDFMESHPNATQDDLMAERDSLFVEHGCISRYYEDVEKYPDWCPLSEQEMWATLEYMRKLETEQVLDTMKLLGDRECHTALQKLNRMMTGEIEGGTSPGSNL